MCALATHQAAIANAFGAVDQAAPICEAARPRRDEGATPCNIIARRPVVVFIPESSLSSCPVKGASPVGSSVGMHAGRESTISEYLPASLPLTERAEENEWTNRSSRALVLFAVPTHLLPR